MEYSLTPDDLVIADMTGPVALAGVIGGMNTAVSDTTTSVLWESATFDATTVRLTAQRHGVRTDSSTRYEKSLDPILAGETFVRVGEYLRFLGKYGESTGEFYYLDSNKCNDISLTVSYDLISKKAGKIIEKNRIETILANLGFETVSRTEKDFTVKVPSWRATKDVSIEEDVVEEILRIYGYDNIEPTPLVAPLHIRPKNKTKELEGIVLEFLSARGWNEVYNYSFTNLPLQSKSLLKNPEDLIAIANAYTEDFTHMRSSLAPRLFESLQNNIRHGNNIRFFEIGNIYSKNTHTGKELADLLTLQDSRPYGETKKLAGVVMTDDVESLRQDLERLFEKIVGYVPDISQNSEGMLPFFHPGFSGTYRSDEGIFASIGKIHPSIAVSFEIPENTWYFEVDFELLFDLFLKKETIFKRISPYQAVSRELNFILDEKTETGTIADAISSTHPWIGRVIVDSVYRDDEKIGTGKKSVNFAFFLQGEGTISDEEAGKIQNDIVEKIEKM